MPFALRMRLRGTSRQNGSEEEGKRRSPKANRLGMERHLFWQCRGVDELLTKQQSRSSGRSRYSGLTS